MLKDTLEPIFELYPSNFKADFLIQIDNKTLLYFFLIGFFTYIQFYDLHKLRHKLPSYPAHIQYLSNEARDT